MKNRPFFLYSLILLFLVSISPLQAEYYSGNTKNSARIIRVPIWVFLEGQPGTMQEDEGSTFLPPKEALQELSLFLLSGMSYGWSFNYTPQDNQRKVDEAFQIEPINGIKIRKSNITFTQVSIKYPYVHSWAEYTLNEDEIARHSSWASLKYKTIKGAGEGMRKDESEGVRTAYHNAIKKAILDYAKKTIKNKPKEIRGEVLIKNSPRLYCTSGLFKAEVELYINVKEIIPYSVF